MNPPVFLLRAYTLPSLSVCLSPATVVKPVSPPSEEDASDGRADRRRHGLPQRQQVCPQRSGGQELHGGRGLHC